MSRNQLDAHRVLVATVFFLVAGASATGSAADSPEPTFARQILDAAGVQGGLIVHLGCGDGRLTAALGAGPGYLVHGLDADADKVQAAREYVQSQGLYGRVSIAGWSDSGRLPYVDNLVNLIVVSEPGGELRDSGFELREEEIRRVLAPGGVAVRILPASRDAQPATRFRKPWPAELDQWTHYLHDTDGNPVSRDAVVGPPRHLQWVGSPTWTRHHDHMSSFTAMVSAGGRVFYIMDEGLRAEIQLPAQWSLIARDAFNGTVLWKLRIENWQHQLWPAKSGPAQLPRRLVAMNDLVYVALGLDSPVLALDAATGRTIRTYEQTKVTEEILGAPGVLLLVVNDQPGWRPWSTRPNYPSFDELRSEVDTWSWDGSSRRVLAVEADTGKTLWQHKSPVVPLTLTADGSRVFFHDGQKVVCLDRAGGQPLWTSQPLARAAEIRSWFAPTLVVSGDVVLFAGAEKMVRHTGGKDTMTALSAKTGEVLWTAEHPASGYDSPEDVLIIDGLVWTAPLTNRRDTGQFTGRDLLTGEIKRTFPSDCGDHMPHHRCHRAKATERYILASRTGIEYVDLDAEHWNRHDWVRGACLYGIMPANGLTYAPPQSCACYVLAKLNGLNALAPARAKKDEGGGMQDEIRLETGPAYGDSPPPSAPIPHSPALSPPPSADWPTYRRDGLRSGYTTAAVPAELKRAWSMELRGPLSSPVVAEGLVLVAAIDQHAVHALDEQTGAPRWRYTVGGRVDSPPTVWRGRVLFGSADGHVYCLRATDGALMWRFRAAPQDQRLVAFEQLESVWPVHGSVLVHEGIVHGVAGRSMFLDGGLRYLRLDAASGRLISETVMDERHPESGQPLDANLVWPNLPVALPDILSCDGRRVYMRSQPFDLEGRRLDVSAPNDYKDQSGEGAHLFCNTGFLDDSWWHRSLWLYGKQTLSGAGGWYTAAYRAPAGRIMVCDAERVYAFDRQPQYYPRTTALEYHLYAAGKAPKILGGDAKPAAKPNRAVPSRPAFDWSYQLPVIGRALVLADQTLFVAGPPDLVDQELSLTRLDDPEVQRSLADQRAAYEGRRGAMLLAVSASEGRLLAGYRLGSLPRFDGMAAANGRLYLACTDGKVICLGTQGEPLEPVENAELKTPEVAAARGGVPATASHPEFAQLTAVRLTPCELGWRLQGVGGQVSLAVKKLPAPSTRQATFKFRMHLIPRDKSADPPRNGFFVFGAEPDDEHLVKCGVRRAAGSIIQGPLLSGKAATRTVDAKIDAVLDVTVTVDLDSQNVTMTIGGQTIETTLTQRLDAVRYIGYCVQSLTTEFSEVEVLPARAE